MFRQKGDRPMANCEETDFQGSPTVLGKRKRKKNSRKDHQEEVTWKKDDIWKKKKKKGLKCKDMPGTKKEKKKDKKKKKRKISIGPDSDLVFPDVRPAQADPAAVYRTQSLRQCQDQEPKPKRKKKVAFDLSPGNIRVKRPQFTSSTAQPKESAAFENKTQGDMARLMQDNNSPCNSEDVNSQDLFITQKTFRALSPEPCSGDTIAATPTQMLAQQSTRNEKREPKGSARGWYGRQCPWKSPMTEPFPEEMQEEGKTIKIEEESSKNGESCSQVKAKLRGNSSEYKFVHARPRVGHFPTEATVVNAPESWTSSQQISTSTQTENFFTIELSSYLRFTRTVSACSVDLDPLDLSLPQRARKDPGMSLLGDQIKGNRSKSPGVESRGSFKIKEVKKEPAGCVAETNLSCCSESGSKSADSTASSGEEQTSRTKLDLTQVRAVQTRLNESFFFKTKGDGQSPRPESPLMKLIQGRDGRSRK
ncbi:uncharacterized protein isoform X2 [Takifugu rubripes]|uniref:uncharacterized protein isoform X2 n=1 Tax=Takifugu rubripes TaxID=31033 RepID=UPI00114553D8|nr:uncharacterized protein LOC115251098 isoform X2 [Takifugu rubripes]